MRLSSPAEDLFGLLKRYSGDKLTRPEDLALLLEAASQHTALDTLEELSFHAKFVASAGGSLRRVGATDPNTARLSSELQTEIATVTRLVRLLLVHSPLPVQERFASTYGAATPESLENLFALCYDLSWYKNWLLETSPNRVLKKQSSAVWRGALIVLVIGTILWLGSVNARAVLANELLVRGTLTLNAAISPEVERQIYREWSGLGIVMIIGYVLVLAAGMVFLIRSPFRLRDHGWLMMSAILLFLFVPVEVYVMVLDVRMILLAFAYGGTLPAFRELFIARLSALGGAPLVAVLCYYTIIALAVVQPFRRQSGASR